MGRQPHCAAENFRGIRGVACDMEQSVLNAPAAAECEGHAVSREGDLGAVGVHPIVVGIIGEGLLDCVYGAVNVGLCHAGYLDRHIGDVLKTVEMGSNQSVDDSKSKIFKAQSG